MLSYFLVFVSVKDAPVVHAGKAIALALGIGLGAAGAGAGIGNIFGSMIQSVARQPELRGELQGLMWLCITLTAAAGFFWVPCRLPGIALALFSSFGTPSSSSSRGCSYAPPS